MTQYKNKGFTLVELMIVIGIIGVLAAIAFPSYQKSVMKSKRTDAKSALLSLQLAQEKYRANCPQYATGIDTATRTCTSGGTHNLVGKTASENGYYTITTPIVADATTYTLTATATGTQAQDTDCATLSINQAGLKTSTAGTATAPGTADAKGCWK